VNTTKRKSPLLPMLLFGCLIAGVGAVYEKTQDDGLRSVTFYGAVGDGKDWAGGFTLTVTVNARSTPYTVKAQPQRSAAINTFSVVRKVKPGTAVGVLVTADWPGKLCKAQLRGSGVDARPAITTSPMQPYASTVVK
jgi:hypothetical protein